MVVHAFNPSILEAKEDGSLGVGGALCEVKKLGWSAPFQELGQNCKN